MNTTCSTNQIIKILGKRAIDALLKNPSITKTDAKNFAKSYLRKGNSLQQTAEAAHCFSLQVTAVRTERQRFRPSSDTLRPFTKEQLEQRLIERIQKQILVVTHNVVKSAHYGEQVIQIAQTPTASTHLKDGGQYSGRCKFQISLCCITINFSRRWHKNAYQTGLFQSQDLAEKGIILLDFEPITREATWAVKGQGRTLKVESGYLFYNSATFSHFQIHKGFNTALRAYNKAEAMPFLQRAGYDFEELKQLSQHEKMHRLCSIMAKIEEFRPHMPEEVYQTAIKILRNI